MPVAQSLPLPRSDRTINVEQDAIGSPDVGGTEHNWKTRAKRRSVLAACWISGMLSFDLPRCKRGLMIAISIFQLSYHETTHDAKQGSWKSQRSRRILTLRRRGRREIQTFASLLCAPLRETILFFFA